MGKITASFGTAALVLALTATAALGSPALGDLVRYRVGTSQYNLALVGRVVSGSNVDLQVLSDGTTWADSGAPAQVSIITYLNVALGTAVGTYQVTTLVADAAVAGGAATQSYVTGAIATATSGLASTSYVGSAVAGLASESYVDGLGPSYLALPPAPSSAGLTLGGSGVQLSSTRPVHVVVRGTASMTSTLGSVQGYTVELRCDANTTPTAVVDDATGSLTLNVGSGIDVQPWKLVALARAGDKCRVVQSAGAATLTLTGSPMQAL